MDDSWYVGSKGPEWVVTLRRLCPGDLFRRRVKKVAATEEGLKKEKQELLDLVKEQHTGEMTEAAVKKLGAAIDKWHISKTPVADIEARRATFLENAVSFGPTVAHSVGDLRKTETFRNQGFHATSANCLKRAKDGAPTRSLKVFMEDCRVMCLYRIP